MYQLSNYWLNQIKLIHIEKYNVDVCLSISQAGIYRKVPLTNVNIDGKVKVNATSDNGLLLQKVNGSFIYGVLELTCKPFDNTRIVKQ